jgi:putative hydrolase of the HAD superfamily
MPVITNIFFDIGGVLLTDGWGFNSRRAAAEQFQLDWEEYSYRHERVAHSLETNQLSLERYLDRAVFYQERHFSREEFRAFIFAQSQPKPESLEILRQLAASKRYRLGVINNEILELNLYRIEHFGLREFFPTFFSSCFLGQRKPDEAIYRTALYVTQCQAAESIFIDDRKANLDCPRELGMLTIHFENAEQLRQDLRAAGVDVLA